MRRQPTSPARRPVPRFRSPFLRLELLEDREVPATLSLGLANAALIENGPATTATVTRTGDLSQALTVAIANSDTTEATAPTSVVIAAGEASATFAVGPVDDTLVDGTQSVTLTATAATGPVTVRPDPTFGAGGYATTPEIRGGGSLNPGAVLLQPDGTIVAAASVNPAGNGWAIRFQTPNGTGGGTTYVFFPGYAEPGTVYALARQADGKILVAGDARSNGVTDWALTRLNADGSHDATFGNSGTVVIPHVGYDSIYDLEVAADGTILVGGFWAESPNFRVTRLTADGAVIGSVNVPVRAPEANERAYGTIADMALDADGKLLLVGTSTVYVATGPNAGDLKERSSAVVRLNADLSPDTSFGPGGVRTITGGTFGSYAQADVVAVEVVGGKVVVGGTAWRSNYPVVSGGEFAVARFNADGTPDTSFAGDGTATLSLYTGYLDDAEAFDLVVQPDGKIVVAGSAWKTSNGTNQALARFNPNGTPDSSFNGTGYYVAADYPQQGAFEQINAVALQPDGRLVAQAGGIIAVESPPGSGTYTNESRQWIARFDMATGEAISASAGLTVADDDPELTLSISPTTFSENGGTATATLTRTNLQIGSDLVVTLTSNDTTEATVPTTVTIPAGQASVTFAVTGVDDDQPDGTQTVTIFAEAAGLTAAAVVSVTDDDPTGPALIVTVDRTGVLEQTGANAAVGTVRRYGLPTDQPLVVTLSSSDTTEATVPTTVTILAGQLTATFPITTVDDSTTDGSQAVTITASVTVQGMTGPLSLDSSWGTSGYQSGFVRGRVAVAPDGKLVAAGTTGTVGTNADFGVRRFTATGAADTTFGTSSGFVTLNVAGASDQVEAVVVQADGKVVVVGTAGTTEIVVARLNVNGTTDGTFGQNGVVRLTPGGTVGVFDVAVQADGKLVVSGFIGADFVVVRLNTNGTTDGPFGQNGVVRTTMSAAATAYGVAVAPDGKIVAVGVVGEGTGASQGLVVARYTAAGVPDSSFANGGVSVLASSGYDERATDVRVQPDGKVVVGARLRNTTTGTFDYAALRLNTDGSYDNGFGTGGMYVEPTASTVGGPARIVLQSDGRVLLAGTTAASGTFYVRFARLTPAGVLEDRSNGAWSVSSTEDMAQDAAGNVYLAYKYGSTGGSGYIDRYKSAGTTVFGQGGFNVLDNEPFAAVGNSYSTTEETPLTVSAAAGVRANDTVTAPLSATSVTAELVSGPTRGTLSFNADGSFTYTPQANFAGTDAFTYRLRDGIGVSNTATVSITVANANDAPVAANDAYTVAEDGTLTVAVAAGTTSLSMVSDAGDWIGQGQTYNLSPANGTFSVSGNANYLTVNYQHPTNGSNYWSLTFRSPFDNVPLTAGQYVGATRAAFRTPGNPGLDITGQHRGSNTLTGFFTVLQIEVSPTGQVTRFAADFEQHSEGATPALRGSVRFNYAPGGSGVLSNDSDPDGDPLSAILVSGPAHGQLALNANGTLTYTPDANYFGPDSFIYKANDGALDSNVATVNLTVTSVNDPPVGANDTATTAEDTPVLIDVLANDTDPEGNTLSIGALTQPQFGTVSVQNGRVLYTPPANWSGTTTFTYRPTDVVGAGPNGNVTTVTVTVTPTPDAPVAGANNYTTDQGVTLTVTAPGVLGNDTDPDGDALTASVVSGPANGVLTLNADGSFSYAPDPAFFGTDSFTYAANDGTGLSGTATVTLTVLRTNDPPVAQDDTATTNEDTQVGIAVITNDSDPNGDPIMAVVLTQPANGSAQYSANDGRIYYMPRANWSGTDTFTYRAWDGRAYSAPATVTVTVLPVNDAPLARNDFFQTNEDTPRTVTVVEPNNPLGVLWNDTDAEGTALTAVLVAGPANGTLALNADGSFTYTPNLNWFGTDTFTYRASDGQALGNVATVTLSVTSVNDAPVGTPDAATINEDTSFLVMYGSSSGAVTANDTDVEDASNRLAIGAVSQPQFGTLEPAATFAGYIYRPPLNWSGTDTFQYRPRDLNQALGNWTTVTITVTPVNDAPVGQPDVYYVDEDGVLTVPAAGVLANDTDPEGAAFTAVLLTPPQHGTVSLNPDGSFTYTPHANYFGSDLFTYRPAEAAQGGTLLGNATAVSIGVRPVNDPPVANPDTYTVAEDGTLTVSGTAPSIDQQSVPPGGGGFTYQVYNAGLTYTEWQQKVVAGRAGTLASFDLFIDSFASLNASFDVVLYKGGPWRSGTPDFSTRLTITAANRGQWVTFDTTAAGVVLAAGEAFTIGTRNGSGQNAGIAGWFAANGDNYVPGQLWYNGSITGTGNTHDLFFRTRMNAVSGVLANDSDPENNPLTAVLVGGPANGTLTLAADGGFTYRPNANYFGPDTFTYKANDGALDSNVTTVTVNVTPVNDAPTLTDVGGVTVDEDAGATVVTLAGISAGGGESQTLTVTATSGNTALIPHPTVNYTSPATGGTLTFTPTANASGTALITVTVGDGLLATTRQFVVTVTPVNDAPVAAADTATVAEDGSVTVAVLANDTDIDGDQPAVSGATNGANGTVAFTAAGVTYTPNANFFGPDTFTYSVSDGNGGTATASVTVTVTAVNDAPVAAADTATVAEDGSVVVAVLANDTDIDGDPLTVTGATSGANGTVTFTADGVTYTPAANFFGTDTFTYTVSDGSGGTATGTVTVTIDPVNDAPTLGALNSVTIAEDAGQQTVSLSGIAAGPNESQTLTTTASSSNPALIPNPTVSYTSPGSTGTLTFTPVANASGTATITVTVSDGDLTATQTFTVTVTPVNDAPVAANDTATVAEDGAVTVAVRANDTDIDGDPLTVTGATNGANGTVTITAGNVTYTPAANYFGTDTFTYTISDGNGGTATASVTVTVTAVNDAPVAANDTATVAEDGTVTVAVRANDTDVENNPLTVTAATNGANGTVAIVSGSVRYTPAANFFGTDTFTYTISDGNGGTATGTVTVTVTGVNDAPTLGTIGNVSILEDAGPQTVNLSGISAGPGGESQALTITASSSNTALIPTPAVGYTNPNASGTLSFTPTANASGTATITVTVSDGALTATRTFTVTVTAVNDAPTLNALNNVTILEDAAQQTVNLSGIGAGPGETATLSVTSSSSNTALIPNPTVTYTSANTTGSIRFTPVANANGTATVTVTVSDGVVAFSRQFTVTVTAVNDAPNFTAGANQSVVAGSGPRTVSGWATSLSRGPADEAGQGLAFTVTTTNAALFVAAPSLDAAGNLTFTPEASATGSATVTVVLKDTGGTANGGVDTSVTRTFTITLTSNGLPSSSGVRTVGSELVVTGGNNADTITVTPRPNNQIRITLNGTNYDRSLSGITRLRVDSEGGNDTINLSAISLPTWTDAGSGDDTVTGGGGADQIYLGAGNDTADGGGGNDLIAGGAGEDLIQGGAGDDDLYGGDNDDFVIGGPGLDDLYGGLGNDILVGGTAAVVSGSDSLRKVLTDWNPAASGTGGYANLRSRLVITDDGVADRLRGDAGTDWFWVGGVDLELDTPEQRN